MLVKPLTEGCVDKRRSRGVISGLISGRDTPLNVESLASLTFSIRSPLERGLNCLELLPI